MKTIYKETSKTTKREEIVARAYAVFYRHGLHSTGVDTVLADSGISKRTLYKYFRTKEELIEAVVNYYQQQVFEKIPPEVAARSSDPKQQILSLFDLKTEAFEMSDFGGCFVVNAKLEFKGKEAPIEAACGKFYELFEGYVESLCRAAQCANAEKTAHQLMILFVGGVVLGQVHHDAVVIATAKEMARTLLEHGIGGSKKRLVRRTPASRARRSG